MKKKSPKIFYDKENKVLSFEIKEAKSVDSDIQGNFVIDYDKNGEIVRVNIYSFNFDNFKNNLKDLKNFGKASDILVSAK